MTVPRLLTPVVATVIFLAVTVGVVATGGVDAFDTAVAQAALTWRRPGVTALAQAWTTLGAFPVVVGIAVVAAVVLRLRTRRWLASAVLATSVLVTAGTVYLVKIAVARVRPAADTLVGVPSVDYAFPSGHTTDGSVAIVLAAVLLAGTVRRPVVRRVLLASALVLAVGVGLTRVYLGYHWATDVIAGWSLATAVIGIAATASRALAGPAALDPSYVPVVDAAPAHHPS